MNNFHSNVCSAVRWVVRANTSLHVLSDLIIESCHKIYIAMILQLGSTILKVAGCVYKRYNIVYVYAI